MAKKTKQETLTTAQALNKFASARGLDISQVFDHFLQYIIWAHTLPEYGKPIKGWPYKPEESKELYDVYVVLVNELNEQLRKHEWYDIFGRIYEELVAGKGRRQDSGQFFTPPSICNLMSEISSGKDENCVGGNISDPTCGSGRNLLAFHALHPGNYHVGEDLDQTCCMMTVCNFILHGVNGEVVWHNSLDPDDWKGGWRVNEGLNNPFSKYYGIPHVRPMEKEEYIHRLPRVDGGQEERTNGKE